MRYRGGATLVALVMEDWACRSLKPCWFLGFLEIGGDFLRLSLFSLSRWVADLENPPMSTVLSHQNLIGVDFDFSTSFIYCANCLVFPCFPLLYSFWLIRILCTSVLSFIDVCLILSFAALFAFWTKRSQRHQGDVIQMPHSDRKRAEAWRLPGLEIPWASLWKEGHLDADSDLCVSG